eukprot:6204206-Pleurochrysis_carterae.AAC.6
MHAEPKDDALKHFPCSASNEQTHRAHRQVAIPRMQNKRRLSESALESKHHVRSAMRHRGRGRVGG